MERGAINIEEEYAKVDGRTVKTTFGVKLKLRMFFTWSGGAANYLASLDICNYNFLKYIKNNIFYFLKLF